MLRNVSAVLLLVLAMPACGGDTSGEAGVDASSELGVDAGRDFGTPDMGPVCAAACTGHSLCCDGADGGAPFCASYDTDDQNCGGCGIVCAAGRGTHCFDGNCVCGLTDVGCGGVPINFCCPARSDAGVPYCANLLTDGSDCGDCNQPCDPARGSSCSGGHCYCGTVGRTTCGGTDSDHCCVDTTGQGTCVDTTSDREHCGECDRRCILGQTCLAGTCTLGTETCAGGCGPGLSCCHGACCTDAACSLGACAAPDAGP